MKTRIATLLLGLVWLLPAVAFAQTGSIQGVVTDRQTGEPLPGANVVIQQLNRGAATDLSGQYDIQNVAPGTYTVVARFVGYERFQVQVTVGQEPHVLNIRLQPDLLGLGEVVVTGVAGETPQRKVPFTIGRVSERELQEVPAVSAASALQGKVAGVRVISNSGAPGSAATIRLRGSTSLTGGQQPLIIVDGLILDGTLADINSEDIESMEVLKGAAAASLYGSRAANGVIQIITRRGSQLATGATRVTVRNEFGVSFLSREIPLSEHHPYRLNADGSYFLNADGNRVLEDHQLAVNPYPNALNLQREIFEPGNFYTNHVTVGRNYDGGNFQISFANAQQDGIMYGLKGYGRQNLRLNLDQDLGSNFRLALSSSFARSNQEPTTQGSGSPFFTMLMLSPSADIYGLNPDGSPYNVIADPYVVEPNPLYALENQERDFNRARFLGDARLTFSPLQWLSFEGSYGIDRGNQRNTTHIPRGYLNRSGGSVVPGVGELTIYNNENVSSAASLTGSVNHAFGDLATRLRLSYLYEDRQYDWINAIGRDLSVGGVPRMNLSAADNRTIESWTQEIKTENVFAIVGLDYRDRYIADFLVRRDGSSEFGPDNRYAWYYRASGAYRLTEDFDIPGVDELRLRASYGTAGLRPQFDAQYETFTIVGGAPVPQTLGNRDLRPAKAAEFETGLNVEFLNRFNFEFNYADNTTTDQIVLVPLSAAAGGFQQQWQNAGTLTSQAYEASLGAVVLQRPSATWQLNLNFDRIRQQVGEIDFPERFVGPTQQSSAIFYLREGETFGVVYGRRWARTVGELADNPAYAGLTAEQLDARFMVNELGHVVERSAHGTTAETPLRYVDSDNNMVFRIGDTNPDFTIGLGSTLNIAGFSLYTLFDWTQGGDIYNLTRQWIYREQRHADFDQAGVDADRRKPVSYWSALYDGNNTNDHFIEDGTYLKLRELALSYQLGSSQLNALGGHFNRVRLGVIGRNLFTITNYSGYDPDVAGLSGDASNFRIDHYNYPNYRTFTGFLEFTF